MSANSATRRYIKSTALLAPLNYERRRIVYRPQSVPHALQDDIFLVYI
ncbi:MAG: hypothetical protein ACFBSC_04185 [Microcoleaceae cyanobacterium]